MALFLTGILLATALLAPLALSNEEVYQRNVRRRLEGPSADHILGTDNLGRDILKRTLYATPLTLQLAVSAAGMAIVIGFTAGAVTAYLPGRLRNMGVRLIEIMLAFPGILIAIMLVAVVGTSAEGAVLAIGIAFSPSLARVAYTLASGVAGLDYIASARVLGLSSRRIVFRYIVPNIAETLIVVSFNATAAALVAVSSLSFLGLGVQGTQFDWGPPYHGRCAASVSSAAVGSGAGDCHRHYRLDPRILGRSAGTGFEPGALDPDCRRAIAHLAAAVFFY